MVVVVTGGRVGARVGARVGGRVGMVCKLVLINYRVGPYGKMNLKVKHGRLKSFWGLFSVLFM